MGGMYPGDGFADAVFENPGFGNHRLVLQFEGVESNRSAFGARIRVDVVDSEVRRSVYREVNTGGSFGTNPVRQTLGLGTASSIEAVEVYWPSSGRTQRFERVPMDSTLRIME